MTTSSILLLPGSLRQKSFTTALLRAAGDLIPDAIDHEIVDLIRPLPFYDADLDVDPFPASVVDVRRQVAAAGGLIIATPQYNATVPGGVKNWVDWVTRPFRAHPLVGKPVVIIGASPGPKGGLGAVTWLSEVLGLLGARVVDTVTFSEVPALVTTDGVVPEAIERLRPLVHALIEVLPVDEPTESPASA